MTTVRQVLPMFKHVMKMPVTFAILFIMLCMWVGVTIAVYNHHRMWNEYVTNAPVVNIHDICETTGCVYLTVSNVTYVLDDVTGGLRVLEPGVRPPYSGILSELLHARFIPDKEIVVFYIDWLQILTVVSLLVALISIVIINLLSNIRTKAKDDSNKSNILVTKLKYSLESDMRMVIAATAHHEMLTPIAVIRATLSKLEEMWVNKICPTSTDGTFRLLWSTVDRLESVLTQMSADRNITNSTGASILETVESTIQSLQVICTEFKFKYKIIDAEVISNIYSNKLSTGTVSNIFNNLVKNSLEAGADRIRIVPNARDNFLDILVIDNGVGISTKTDPNINRVFDLGYSSKDRSISIIDANKDLSKDISYRGDGLHLVKIILKNVGGCIKLVSTSCKGTVFMVTLPIKQVPNIVENLKEVL